MMHNKLNWIKDIKAIGWDLDGTLYPANTFSWQLIRDKQIEKIMQVNGWEKAYAVEQFEATIAKLGSNTETMIALGADGHGFFHQLWDELPLADYIRKDEVVGGMFARLSHFRHFLVSNSNLQRHIATKLALIGIPKDVFEVLLSTDELGVSKPDPKPFEVVLARMKLKPGQCLYVGDRVETDIVGARGVGMRTCLVGKQSDLADLCVGAVGELERFF